MSPKDVSEEARLERLRQLALVKALELGQIVAEMWPPIEPVGDDGEGNVSGPGYACAIRRGDVEPITDLLMEVMAELMQAWTDAGSEREVTLENELLREGLQQEVIGWAWDPDARTSPHLAEMPGLERNGDKRWVW